jgi:hypothetical protein
METVRQLHSNRHVRHPLTDQRLPVIHVSTHIYPDEMVSCANEIRAFVDKFGSVADAVVVKPTMLSARHTAFDHYVGQHEGLSEDRYRRTQPCFETSRRLAVAVNGDVWCGHNLPEDFGEPLGSVHEQSVIDIWRGPRMTKFRTEVRAGRFGLDVCQACGGELREGHVSRHR